MDAPHFEQLLRQVARARSRRGAVLGVLGGIVGLLGLSETEARRHRKKPKHPKHPKHPVSPPAGPRCPASCPLCQECINGASCTVQSDFTPCGDDGCNVCQGGACVNRPDGTTCGDDGRCQDGVCGPKPAFCEGKDTCAQPTRIHCNTDGSSGCHCFALADNSGSFCGDHVIVEANACSECAEDRNCVIFGGECNAGFGCVLPCQDPL
jgi:hypothetical protein